MTKLRGWHDDQTQRNYSWLLKAATTAQSTA
jgi:hypothetical protein